MNSSKNALISGTLFHIVIPVNHPSSILFTQDRIKEVFKNYGTIKDYAYILHDKDNFTIEDEKRNPQRIAGTPKPHHYHLILRSDIDCLMNSLSVSKWLTVSQDNPIRETDIEKPETGGGVRGFNKMLIYFTHTSEECRSLGKAEYPIENIKSNIVNIQYRVESIFAKRIVSDSLLEEAMDLVYSGKATPDEAINKYKFPRKIKIIEKLTRSHDLGEKNRKKDLMKKLESITMPETRINFYIFGEGGTGKTVLCDALAYFFYPELKVENRVFNTSSELSSVRGYLGQPVIIWDECKGEKLIKDTGNQGNLLKIFRPHPRKETVNVKFGEVILLNKYNLVNSSEDFNSFISNISLNDNIKQYYRRFPIYIEVKNNEVLFFVDERVYNYNVCYGDKYNNIFTLNICIGELCNILSPEELNISIELALEDAGFRNILTDIEKSIQHNRGSQEEKNSILIKSNIDPKRLYQRIAERNKKSESKAV